MQENEIGRQLAETLRQAFGAVLELPIFTPPSAPSPKLSPADFLEEYSRKIRFCENCSLHIGRSKLVFGRGHWNARLAFVGDFPSDSDDQAGEPFSGASGALLHKMILAMKVRPEETYLTNIYKCRPAPGTRLELSHFQSCQEHLRAQFSQVRAPVIVALGEAAAQAFSRSDSPLQVLRRQVFTWEGRQVIPTHHPRELQDSQELKKEAWSDLQNAMGLLDKLS